MQELKYYALVGQDLAIERIEYCNYFFEILEKVFPSIKWNKIYTDNIPTDGNIYIALNGSIVHVLKKFYEESFISKKDILLNSYINKEQTIYIESFDYNLDLLKTDKDIKKSAFIFLKEIFEKNINLLIEFKNTTNEIILPIEENESFQKEIPLLSPIEDNSNIISIEFNVDELISQLSDSQLKNADKSLNETFDGIELYSSKDPDKKITIANSLSKGKYKNKILISELLILIKCSLLLNTDCIKFNIRDSTTDN